jgi:hypothetical protein
MVKLRSALTHDLRIQEVVRAETDDFSKLLKIAGLDPKRHLRFADWSGVSFQNSDLQGFDFTGARLLHCDFAGALIAGARFDQAEIGRDRTEASLPATRLQDAADWHKYVDLWTRSDAPPSDDHLPLDAIFRDAPAAPELRVKVPSRGDEIVYRNSEGGKSLIPPLKPFALSAPVTVEQFIAFQQWKDRFGPSFLRILRLERPPRRGSWRYPEGNIATHGQPITGVTEGEAITYVKWLSHHTGIPYCLIADDGGRGFRVGRLLRSVVRQSEARS